MQSSKQRFLFRDRAADDSWCDASAVGLGDTGDAGIAIGGYSKAEDIGDVLPLVGGSPDECRGKADQAGWDGDQGGEETFECDKDIVTWCSGDLLSQFDHLENAITYNPESCSDNGRDNQWIDPKAQADYKANASRAPDEFSPGCASMPAARE